MNDRQIEAIKILVRAAEKAASRTSQGYMEPFEEAEIYRLIGVAMRALLDDIDFDAEQYLSMHQYD